MVGKNVKIVVGCVSLTLPKINSLKRTIQRERTEGNSVPVHPESLQELEIPLNYPRTSKNESFLLYDSGPEERRDLILEHEKLAQIWLADGTFKTAPIQFENVYCVNCSGIERRTPTIRRWTSFTYLICASA